MTRDCPHSRHNKVIGLGLAPCPACDPARALPRHCLPAAQTLPAALTGLAVDPSHSCAMRSVSYMQHQRIAWGAVHDHTTWSAAVCAGQGPYAAWQLQTSVRAISARAMVDVKGGSMDRHLLLDLAPAGGS